MTREEQAKELVALAEMMRADDQNRGASMVELAAAALLTGAAHDARVRLDRLLRASLDVAAYYESYPYAKLALSVLDGAS